MIKRYFFVLALVSIWNMAFSQGKETVVLVKTDKGNIKLKLYNETPKHKENFIKLVNQKFYDGVLFHRVIKDFMIQTGDPDSKNAEKGKMLGNGGPGYTLPAEFNAKFYHKKGALSAARLGDNMNPKKESSGSQFYIVHGKKFTDQELAQMENSLTQQARITFYQQYIYKPENKALYMKIDSLQKARNVAAIDQIIADLDKTVGKDIKPFKFSESQREAYKTFGGAPHLDGGYTVFGEVLEGFDVIDKIAIVERDSNDRPLEDVKIITVELLK